MKTDRRKFLQSSMIAGAASVASPYWLRAADVALPEQGVVLNRDTKALIKLIDETDREHCPQMLAEQLRAGVPYRELMAAAFLFAALRDGHHTVYLVHGTHQLTLQAAPDDRVLPLFWAVDNMKEALARARAKPVEPLKGPFPSPSQASNEFEAAMAAMDRDKAEHAIVALSRAVGPKQAYAKILSYASRDNHFIGHIPIAITTAGRALDALGWHHAEPILRYLARDCYRFPHTLDGQPYPHNVERVQKTYPTLPADWAGRVSNPSYVRELVAHMQQLKWWKTNDWIAERLADGRIQAGTVWDAIFLFTSDLMIRHKFGGLMIGRLALHTNTTSNALRYAYDTLLDPKQRYLAMLQAVAWNIESLITETSRRSLRERSIFDLQTIDVAANDSDVVDEIFSTLPPRYFQKEIRDRTGQDRAAALMFSLAQRSPQCGEYFAAARRIMSRKLTVNAHEMKYPIAMFEEWHNISAEWRPHLLASSVHFMQSSQSEDCPAVTTAIELLNR